MHIPLVLLVLFLPHSLSQTVHSSIKVTDIKVSKEVCGRIYLAARADSAAELAWSTCEGKGLWTSLNSDDNRRIEDVSLPRSGVSGLVALPSGAIATVSVGEKTADDNGVLKYLTETAADGQVMRDIQIQVNEYTGGGWSSRKDELVFGFKDGMLQYTYWGESTGGGHYACRMTHVEFENLDSTVVYGGCSHSLANRGVWNHQRQKVGLWCMKDGNGGIYQFNINDRRVYKFGVHYGYPTLPLGDIVPYQEGFLLTFGAPRDVDMRENKVGNADISWRDDPGYNYEKARTDVGLIFQIWENGLSLSCCPVWITNTPDLMESSVHAGWLGPNQEQLAVFYVVHDLAAGQSATSPDAKYMVQRVNPEPIRQYYEEWLYSSDPGPKSYQPTCPVGCGALSGSAITDQYGEVLIGPAEEIQDIVGWREHQTFTTFPNGDIGWAAAFGATASDAAEPNQIKLVRMQYNAPTDGGWTDWSPCDCATGLQTRVCAKPVPANGGSECVGAAELSCGGLVGIPGAEFDRWRAGGRNAVGTKSLGSTELDSSTPTMTFHFKYLLGFCSAVGYGNGDPVRMQIQIGSTEVWTQDFDPAVKDYPYDESCGGHQDNFSPVQIATFQRPSGTEAAADIVLTVTMGSRNAELVGVGDGSCVDTSLVPTGIYPIGHDPVTQDPGGGNWLANSGGRKTNAVSSTTPSKSWIHILISGVLAGAYALAYADYC